METNLESIERQLREALLDEEKAVPFYKNLRADLFNAGIIKPATNESLLLDGIIRDEERHKRELRQIEIWIKEYKRTHPAIPGRRL